MKKFVISFILVFASIGLSKPQQTEDIEKSGQVIIAFYVSLIKECDAHDVEIPFFPKVDPNTPSPKLSPEDEAAEDKREKARSEKFEKEFPAIQNAVSEQNPEIESVYQIVGQSMTTEIPAKVLAGPKGENDKEYRAEKDGFDKTLGERAKTLQNSIRESKQLTSKDAIELQKLLLYEVTLIRSRFPSEADMQAEDQIYLASYEAGKKFREIIASEK